MQRCLHIGGVAEMCSARKTFIQVDCGTGPPPAFCKLNMQEYLIALIHFSNTQILEYITFENCDSPKQQLAFVCNHQTSLTKVKSPNLGPII